MRSDELVGRFVKRFSAGTVVEADLRQPSDRFSVTVLFGPSGCGKTTTLRCLAGLERPDEGHIHFGKTPWFDADRGISLTPQQRDIGFLFQEHALFPHLTIGQNIAYGLRRLPRRDRLRRVADILDLFHLTSLDNRYSHQVSSGQQQRVALARVLVRRPRLLLLDEPLSALDQPTREQLRSELRHLLVQFGIPVALVTHDRIEAMALADHLIVLDQGKVRQQGTVAEVFNRPAGVEVARIVGVETVQPGRIVAVAEGLATVLVGNTKLLAVAPEAPAELVYVCIRPEEVVLQQGTLEHASPRNKLDGVVASVVAEGPMMRVQVDCGFPLVALVTRPACAELNLHAGAPITVLLKVPSIHLIARS